MSFPKPKACKIACPTYIMHKCLNCESHMQTNIKSLRSLISTLHGFLRNNNASALEVDIKYRIGIFIIKNMLWIYTYSQQPPQHQMAVKFGFLACPQACLYRRLSGQHASKLAGLCCGVGAEAWSHASQVRSCCDPIDCSR